MYKPMFRGVIAAVLTAGGGLLTAGPVLAAIEFDHAAALAGGVTPGDAPGYPVDINTAGSYLLTSNLEAPGTAIRVNSDDVTLDLGGFVIRPGQCPPQDRRRRPACEPDPAGHGVDAAEARNVTVRDGSVVGMPGTGVRVGEFGHVEAVRAIGNGEHGIDLGRDTRLLDSTVVANAGDGVHVSFFGAGQVLAVRTVARDNGNSGMAVNGGVVLGALAVDNGHMGVDADHSAHVVDVFARGNDVDGIVVGAGSNVTRNTTTHNGHRGASGNGIRAEKGNVALIGNVSYSNQFQGMVALDGPTVAIHNLASRNAVNGVAALGAGSTLIGNAAAGNGRDGVAAGVGSVLVANAATDNAEHGLSAKSGSSVVDGAARNNGLDGVVVGTGAVVATTAASGNGSNGVLAQSGSNLVDNAVRANAVVGLAMSGAAGIPVAYSTNATTANSLDAGFGTQTGKNLCGSSTACP